MTPLRILWVGDSPARFSGYGTVTRALLGRLAKIPEWTLACLALHHPDGGSAEFPYPIFPAGESGEGSFVWAFTQFQPDIVVSIGDLEMTRWLCYHELRGQCRWWPYFPLDFVSLPQRWLDVLGDADFCIAYSDFGRRLVLSHSPSKEIAFVYHGVDSFVFRPLEERAELRRRMGLQDRFIVGCVARNQWRKNLPILCRAFSRFCQGKTNALLYLHTDLEDVIGSNLREVIFRYGIADRVAVTSGNSVTRGVSAAALNEIYNIFDVFALPTSGEGFGLPILEAMAAGVPVIATDVTTCTELLQGRGELLRVRLFQTLTRLNLDAAIPDEDHLVELLDRLYTSPERRAEMAAKGREFALQLDWDIIAQQWAELFRKHGAAGGST